MKNLNSKVFILLPLLFFSAFSLIKAENLEFPTPYQTLETHLKNLEQDNYYPELAAKSIFPVSDDVEKLKYLAISLKQIYDAKGFVVKWSAIPQDSNYRDSATGKNRYYPIPSLPEIYLEKTNGNWFYSKETAELIPKIHASVFRFNTDKILRILPKIGSNKFLGVFVWQLYGIIALIFISYLVFLIFRFLLGFFVFRILIHFVPKETSKKFIKPLSRPLGILISVIFFLIFLPVIQFDASVNSKLIVVAKVLISIFAMVLCYKLVDLLSAVMMKAAQKTESTLDDQLVPLISKTLKVVVIIIGILFILQNFHFKITALLAGISLGGLAIALAAQDSLKNFFGSLLIFVDKPFQIGDWIISNDVNGTVEEIGFRSTRIRTMENSLISIPNGKLADQPIDNMGLRVFRRYKTTLSVTYDTPPFKINNFIEGLKQLALSHPQVRKDLYIIQLSELADYSINILFQIYIIAPDYQSEMKYRHEILMAVLKLAEELNIRWAFPTQTLFVEEFPGQASLTPQHSENEQNQRKKIPQIVSSLKKSFSSEPKKDKMNAQADVEVQKNKQEDVQPSQSRQIINKKGKELLPEEIIEEAVLLKIKPEVLLALVNLEKKSPAFLPDGKPGIIFQGHRFWKELKKRNIDPVPLSEKYPEIVYPNYNRKFILRGEKEYDRLEKAKLIHKEAAYLSTQWGMFNLDGYSFKECGFNSVNEMVHQFYKTEKEQFIAFLNYLKARQAIDDIRKSDWLSYGKKVHGKNFNSEKFIRKMEEKMNELKE